MPLEKSPSIRAPWPPLPKNDPQGRYPEPYPLNGDPNESFWTIAAKTGVEVMDLVRYNFMTNRPEEINWYLKTYVGCSNATHDGNNYTFKGIRYQEAANKGVIFIPRKSSIDFTDMPTTITLPRKKAGDVRWVQFTAASSNPSEPNYMIPGVDQSSTPIESPLPGNSGAADMKAQGVAALVQFLSSTGASRLSNLSVGFRLNRLEPPRSEGGMDVANQLQPVGPYEAVVVMVRRTQNKYDSDFPKLPFGQPIIVGYGKPNEAGNLIESYWRQGGLFSAPDSNSELVYEYYLGTRL